MAIRHSRGDLKQMLTGGNDQCLLLQPKGEAALLNQSQFR
jgi:hypothetical protein